MTAPVIVVGGGWAGLAAAVELARRKVPVTLLESAMQLGGRARSVQLGPFEVDNGQHLMIGAYSGLLELLGTLGLAEYQVFRRQRLQLELRSPLGRSVTVKAPLLPAPLHIAYALLATKGLTAADRWQGLRFCLRMRCEGFALAEDVSVQALLRDQQQSARLIESLWEPLCLATMNTRIDQASATVFLAVLRDAFTRRRSHSDLLFALPNLGQLLPQPAQQYIEQRSGRIELGRRVQALEIQRRSVCAVHTADERLPASHIVLAVPPGAAWQLLDGHPELHAICEDLRLLQTSPICTLYLHYPPEVTLGREMLGLLDATGQWLFDRTLNGQPGLMAVVISGDGPHMDMDKDALGERVAGELAQLFPHWPAPLSIWVIREKRATFRCAVGVEALRPAHATPVKGLWLAGDYTATGYPATLEGAVRSGLQSARAIIEIL